MSDVPLTTIEAGLASQAQPSATPSVRRNRNSLSIARNWILNLLTFREASSTVSNPHTPQEAVLRELIYRHEVNRYPRGWAQIAAEQDHSVNLAIHRKFGNLSQRCFLHVEHKLTKLESELLELDLHIANENQDEEQQGLDGPSNAAARYIEERDRKVEEILSVLAPYRRLILDDKEIGLLYEVGDIEHRLRYGKIKNSGVISREEMAFLYHANDFVSTRPDKLRLSFEKLFYKFRHFPAMKLIEQSDTREEEHAKHLDGSAVFTASGFSSCGAARWFCCCR
ncbi:uncharacterized protein CTRU02_201836 [Colletotrichum truncatum]|uniref:Uncharacterized protein n=1 Tax=Colletotrichum truncatum TaxID=5467 RepID=A0ACC3ZIF5_COLTU|nr:uncharacterized protein CTRU02_06948 [Colletotrichum truncatum]KAF6791764.1 hypothetical protein CTRU02_06948 [Colletotrichum truncatum]